jgi:uncharacterized sporulation protein YeaH/YhbH (DUF444 family)
VVFIRHTTTARECDEEAFFRATDTGGTIVSTALLKMQEIVAERFPVEDWNIYVAQASDGHDFSDDLAVSQDLLREILPICQHFAYVEVSAPHMLTASMESALWSAYAPLTDAFPNFAMRRIASPEEILPVFRRLFARDQEAA